MKFRAICRNLEMVEYEINNPLISWFVVDTPKGRICYMPVFEDTSSSSVVNDTEAQPYYEIETMFGKCPECNRMMSREAYNAGDGKVCGNCSVNDDSEETGLSDEEKEKIRKFAEERKESAKFCSKEH
jgi:hypothetical protein